LIICRLKFALWKKKYENLSTLIGRFTLCAGLIGLLTALGNAESYGSLPTFPVESGFGSQGDCQIRVDSIPHPVWRGHSLYFFHPYPNHKQVPLIIFFHGIGADNPLIYQQLIRSIVSHGYAVIYPTYSKRTAFRSPPAAYKQIWDGITASLQNWKSCTDTTKIGLIGHSYGAGAIPSFTWKLTHGRKFGANGLFIYLMAP